MVHLIYNQVLFDVWTNFSVLFLARSSQVLAVLEQWNLLYLIYSSCLNSPRSVNTVSAPPFWCHHQSRFVCIRNCILIDKWNIILQFSKIFLPTNASGSVYAHNRNITTPTILFYVSKIFCFQMQESCNLYSHQDMFLTSNIFFYKKGR